MTTTRFYNPTTLTNVNVPNPIVPQNPSIDWKYNPTALLPGAYAVSGQPLYTISGLWMEKFLSNTSQLWCTGYKIPNVGTTILGIELQLNILRQARIQDLLIQLTLNGSLIGENMASGINSVQSDMYTGDFTTPLFPVGDLNIYGGANTTWGAELTPTNVADASFGVVISFSSNPIYPHRDLCQLDQAGIRITYA
jgi:hypothetical protein